MTRKYEPTEIRQKQIIDAARKVIIKYGSEHVTVKKIAKEVGISEAAIYRHYKSKSEILSFLIDYIGDLLISEITDPVVSGDTTRLQVLDEVIISHLSSIEQHRGISFQVIAEILSLGDKKLNRKVAQVIDNYIVEIQKLLSDAVKSGEIRSDIDIEAAAFILFGTIQGTVNIWALKGYKFDVQEKYASLWSVYCRALAIK
jgi:AcrR family transcriptional regulator